MVEYLEFIKYIVALFCCATYKYYHPCLLLFDKLLIYVMIILFIDTNKAREKSLEIGRICLKLVELTVICTAVQKKLCAANLKLVLSLL